MWQSGGKRLYYRRTLIKDRHSVSDCQMTIENTVFSVFDPRSSIVKSVLVAAYLV